MFKVCPIRAISKLLYVCYSNNHNLLYYRMGEQIEIVVITLSIAAPIILTVIYCYVSVGAHYVKTHSFYLLLFDII